MKKISRQVLQLAGLLLLMALLLLLGPLARAQAPLRSLGGISEYRLDNGLQVLLMPQAGAPQINLTVTYRVGSRHEGPGEAGMAHLLEHVTFRGTTSVPDIGAELQHLGVRFNGTTSRDRTNYFGSFAADEQVLGQLLKLEASRMHEARLAQADFDKEKPLVLNEMGLRGNAVVPLMQQTLNSAAFRQHPYGRPVIGFTPDIETLSLPTLRAFYARYYRPDNAVLMLAGGFDPARALGAVTEAFGPLARPEEPLPELNLAEPTQQAPRVITLRTRETALAVGYRVPGAAHAQAPGLLVLSMLLPQVASGITQNKERPYTQTILGGNNSARDPTLLGLIVQLPTLASGDAAAREALLSLEEQWLRRLQDLRANPSLERLLYRLADDAATELRKRLSDPMRAPGLISDGVGAGDWRLPFKLLDGLARLKPSEVLALAEQYLRSENRNVVRGVTDASVRAPEFEETPLTGFASLFSKPVEVAQVQDPAVGIGELAAPPAAVAGDAFETDPAALDRAARRYRLPSGLHLGVLAKNSADDKVTVLINLRWGSPAAMASPQEWRVLSTLLEEGAAGRTAEQIKQIKKALQADIRFLSTSQQLLVTLTVKRASLLPALQLVKEMISEPTLSEEVFKREQNAALARLASAARAGNTAQEFERRYRMRQFGLQLGDAGYQPSNAELSQIWRELKVEDVREFQRNNWSGNGALVAVVGQVPDNLLAAVESLFGNWKKPQAPAFERYAPMHVPEPVRPPRYVSRSTSRVPEGAGPPSSANVVLHQQLPLNRLAEDYTPLLIASRILAGGSATGGSRLADRLRARDALSYAVNAQLRVPLDGDRAALRLQASGAPAEAARIEAAMPEELARLLAEGVTAAEVDTARRQLLLERRQRLSSDAGLAAALLTQLDRQGGFESAQALEDAGLEAATPERVGEVLRRLLRVEGWAVVVTGAAAP